MDLCKRTEQLWRLYLSAVTETELSQVLDWIDPHCVVIGTGRHEYYTDLQSFLDGLRGELAERQDSSLRIVDQWYAQRELAPDTYMVYGGLHIQDADITQDAFVDMDTRFTVLYQQLEGIWKVVHIHQSLPYLEQAEGEYYPKALSQQVQEAKHLAERMRQLARLDSLTGLVNHRTFFEEGTARMQRESALWFVMVDLDNFKQINDSLGHLAGDEVLRKIATVLHSSVRAHDLVSRIGGDEFALLCSGLRTRQDAAALAERILLQTSQAGQTESCWPGLSIGLTQMRPGEELSQALSRADQALYQVKKGSKNSYAIQ